MAFDAVAFHDANISEFGAIIDSCRHLFLSCPNFQVKHNANIIAFS